jgi:hypothetical protein
MSLEFTVYYNYSKNSHVLVGRLPDDIREQIKTLKLGNYHPKLYPDTSTPTKGWLIKKDKLDWVIHHLLIVKSKIDPKYANLLARLTVSSRDEPDRRVFECKWLNPRKPHATFLFIAATTDTTRPYEASFTWSDTYVKPDSHLWFIIRETSTEDNLKAFKEFLDYFLSLYGDEIPRAREAAKAVLKLFWEEGIPENLPPCFYEYLLDIDGIFKGLPTVVREGPIRWKDAKDVGCLNIAPP